MRTVALMICAGILSAAFCQNGGESKVMATPALPFYDWGACPYETCGYRQWTAHRSVTVYDTWKAERRPIAQLAVGVQVTGITGAGIPSSPTPIAAKVFRRFGSRASIIPSSTSRSRNGRMAPAAAAHIARALTWTWAG